MQAGLNFESLQQYLPLYLHECSAAHRVVYICGLSGAGKSTMVDALLRYFKENFPDLETVVVPEFLEEVPAGVIETTAASPLEDKIAAQLWIVRQYYLKDQEIKSILRKNPQAVVVVDREVQDCLPFSFAIDEDGSVLAATGEAIAEHSRTWQPGLQISLEAELPVVEERLKKKFSILDDNWTKQQHDHTSLLREAIIALAELTNRHRIDTTSDSEAETLKKIIALAVPWLFGASEA